MRDAAPPGSCLPPAPATMSPLSASGFACPVCSPQALDLSTILPTLQLGQLSSGKSLSRPRSQSWEVTGVRGSAPSPRVEDEAVTRLRPSGGRPPCQCVLVQSRVEAGRAGALRSGPGSETGQKEQRSRQRRGPRCRHGKAHRPEGPAPLQGRVSLAKSRGGTPDSGGAFRLCPPHPKSDLTAYFWVSLPRERPRKSADTGFFFSRKTQACLWVKVSLVSCQHPGRLGGGGGGGL